MRQATAGRDPEDVETSAKCLLALLASSDPTPEQIAGAHLLAFGLVDLFATSERLKG